MITPRTKMNTILISLLFISAVIIVALGWYQLQKLGTILEEQVAMVASHNDREQKYGELSRLVESTVSDRTELAQYLLNRSDAPSFVTSWEQLAAKQGVSYTTDSLKEVEVEKDFDQLLISFTMNGPERNVRHMLKVYESMPYHGDVTSVYVDRTPLADDGTVTMKVQLAVTLSDDI